MAEEDWGWWRAVGWWQEVALGVRAAAGVAASGVCGRSAVDSRSGFPSGWGSCPDCNEQERKTSVMLESVHEKGVSTDERRR